MEDSNSYTFDDEGNPIPETKLPSARKPPTAPKKKRSKKRAAGSEESSEIVPNGAATNVLVASKAKSEGEEPFTDMFHIDGTGYDVTLSLRLGKMYWETMNPSGRRRKRSGSLSGLFKRRKSSSGLKDPSQNSIDMNKLYGARIKRRRKAGQNEEEGFVLGLGLFTFEQKEANVLRERELYFEHPSVEICTKWSEKLNGFINSVEGRPKNVKLFLQSYAGEKKGHSIYKHKILPLFQNAGVAIDLTVIHHNEHVKQEMIHLNIEDFDCVIAMGGDGTANQVLNGLMNRSQKEHDVQKKPGFTPVRAMIPMGIIPIGRTNHIACTAMGTVDPVTASLHIILGQWSAIDVCSVYTTDRFYHWAFNCQYGFAGNVLSFMKRYSSLGNKRVDAAFLKALTSSKLRSYECEIEYIPTPNVIAPRFNTVCRTGCEMCICKQRSKDSSSEVVTDMVQELDLNNSISSTESAGSVIELKQDSPWRTLKGQFMNIGVFAIPGNCEVAPQGLSKVTHRNDGNLDLVVVRIADRKEFVRFLRRHGNSKNQFDFPFVEVFRCKEVRFRPRMPTSWNYNDHDFSEIKYQMNQQQMMQKRQYHSMEVIDVLDASDPSKVRSLQSKSQSMYALDISDEEDEEEEEDEEAEEEEAADGDGDEKGRKKKGKDGKRSNSATGREQSEPPKYHYVGPQYQPTWTEQEIARRKKMARKKEEKKKAREEEKGKSVWNIDNEIHTELELDFRVHSGLLMICGFGISPHTEFDDVRFTCLPG